MTIKRIFALVLSLLMVFALGATVFAVGGESPETTDTTVIPSLTIKDALKGNSYTVYKIFDLESYDKENGHYSYTIQNDSPMYEIVNNMKIGTNKVFELSSKIGTNISYVRLTSSYANVSNDGATIKSIASQLMEGINEWNADPKNADNKISYVRKVDHLGVHTGANQEQMFPSDDNIIVTSAENKPDQCDVKFYNLDFGYYIVDTSAGTMFALNTTDPEAEIVAKNKLPGVVKRVKRNADSQWASENSKGIGEKVEFRLQMSVQPGATNYKLYDIISDGLTFGSITKVYYADSTGNNPSYVVYDSSDSTKNNGDSYFTYQTSDVQHAGQDCCFQIIFKDSFLNQVLDMTITSGLSRTIYVEYFATVDSDAVIEGEGNPNTVHMTYGNNNVEVAQSTTTTYVYEAELVKTNNDREVISGARFELYKGKETATGTLTDKVRFVKLVGQEGAKTVYRVAVAGEDNTVDVIEAGDVIIRGLGGNFETETSDDGRAYYLKEIAAPNGYNLLDAPETFEIKNTNLESTVSDGNWVSGGIRVINKSGTKLPSTGGIGTTIFYVIGGLLVLAAVVLLVTRKRVGTVEDAQK